MAKLSAEVGEPVPVLFTAHSVPDAHGWQAPASRRRRGGGAAAALAGRGSGSVCGGCAADCGAGGGARAGDSALVVCIPEPGRKRRTVDWSQRGGNAGPDCRRGREGADLQPIGFLCDHVEILFDVDIHFREYASELRHSAGAPGVVECVGDVGKSRCGFGAAGISTVEEFSGDELSGCGVMSALFTARAGDEPKRKFSRGPR